MCARAKGFLWTANDLEHAAKLTDRSRHLQQSAVVHSLTSQKPVPAGQLLQILALDDIRNEIIGDEEVRGISGGQRKRVNVGLELVADPVMLFLDEPTSGLDSTSSKMVISALQEVSSRLQRAPAYCVSYPT